MIFFKSCPRCSGDRALESDHYGLYLLCFHCGYVTYPQEAEQKGAVRGPADRSKPERGATGAAAPYAAIGRVGA